MQYKPTARVRFDEVPIGRNIKIFAGGRKCKKIDESTVKYLTSNQTINVDKYRLVWSYYDE